MEITEVRIKLTEDSDDRLQAFCSITFDDCFVVRDLKIIEGTNGPFVAMPSRKLTSHCGRCGSKNHLRACYCNQCGAKLNAERAARDHEGRAKLYADIAHPVNSKCREQIQERVIAAYKRELDLARQPGYVSRYDDAYEDEFTAADFAEHPAVVSTGSAGPRTEGLQGEGLRGEGQRSEGSRREEPRSAPPARAPAPGGLEVGAIQRTDAAAPPTSEAKPHVAPSPATAPTTATPKIPPQHLRPKPNFGAGILED